MIPVVICSFFLLVLVTFYSLFNIQLISRDLAPPVTSKKMTTLNDL